MNKLLRFFVKSAKNEESHTREADVTPNFSTNDVQPKSIDVIQSNFTNVQDKKTRYLELQKHKNVNGRNNISIINVNNSKSFNIGPQTTINVNDCSEEKLAFSNYEICNHSVEWNDLLDNEERLTESIIRIIAVNYEQKWKNFGINLGFDISILDEIEARFVHINFIIYHVLKIYAALFPNTSLGFIVDVLKKNCQFKVIKKILESKNKCFS